MVSIFLHIYLSNIWASVNYGDIDGSKYVYIICIVITFCAQYCINQQPCGKCLVPDVRSRVRGGRSLGAGIGHRILGGDEISPPHGQPWLVRLGRCCHCTGTLISDIHILTAAHCGMYVFPQLATLGDHDAKKIDDGEISIRIKSMTEHPLFWLDRNTAGYDYAIWTLEEPVKFSRTIQPVCLPLNSSENYLGQNVIASGWGKSLWEPNSSGPSHNWAKQVPRKVSFKVLPISECKNARWLSDRLDKITTLGRDINETFIICGGLLQEEVQNKWIGPSNGDSGGVSI